MYIPSQWNVFPGISLAHRSHDQIPGLSLVPLSTPPERAPVGGVLWSASVERFSVSRMRDFYWIVGLINTICIQYLFYLNWYLVSKKYLWHSVSKCQSLRVTVSQCSAVSHTCTLSVRHTAARPLSSRWYSLLPIDVVKHTKDSGQLVLKHNEMRINTSYYELKFSCP